MIQTKFSTDCSLYCAARHRQSHQPQSKVQNQAPLTPTSAQSSQPFTVTLSPCHHLSQPPCANSQQQKRTPTTPLPPTPAGDQTALRNGPASAPINGTPHEYMDPDTDYETAPESTESEPRPILFYHRNEPHFGFTNFSDHPVEYHGRIYPTSEHLFQAFKVRLPFHGASKPNSWRRD